MPHVSGLFLYPVKSLRGFAVDAAEVDALGFVGDRRFLVVDRDWQFLTQRTIPAMARINTALDAEHLTLSADGAGAIAVRRASDAAAALRTVTIWRSPGLLAEDCGDEAAQWLTAFLGTDCRLVRIGDKFLRPVLKSAAAAGDVVHFADAVPLLAISEASLADLNDRLAQRGEPPAVMDRFRPNIVLAGCGPYAEDAWPRFRIGALTLRAAGPCARCIVTTTDQTTGERTGPEPLRTLASYRRDPADSTRINFGQNLIHETKSGTLRVGDKLALL